MRWIKVRSWHIIENEFVSRASVPLAVTLCGRVVRSEGRQVAETFSGAERTCESCLRLNAALPPQPEDGTVEA